MLATGAHLLLWLTDGFKHGIGQWQAFNRQVEDLLVWIADQDDLWDPNG